MSRPRAESRPWQLYVQDMISCSERVLDYSQGLEKETFLSAPINYEATLWNLAVIGEAASNIPSSIRDSNRDIPWREIVGTRHHLVHGYFTINQDLVWHVIAVELPSVLPRLYTILESSSA